MDRYQVTLRQALRSHRAENGLPPDGGVSETWAPVRVGPIPFCIPNVAARRRAIPFPDLNHLLAGFAAFVRGRRTANLYGQDLDAVLDVPVVQVRRSLGLDVEYRGRLSDLVLFGAFVGLAPIVGAIPGIVSIVTSPFWLARGAQRVRRPV